MELAVKFTLEELLKHLDTHASVSELTAAFTAMGHEVDSVSEPCSLENIVVAHIVDVQAHPQADRLRLCKVNDGSADFRTIVCGASNVENGMYVLLAREGAVIPITGQPLKKSSIRGVASEGMMCSAEELCVDFPCEKGAIIKLEGVYTPGTPACDVLPKSPTVIDVALTPNRGDCWSVQGLARDIAAYGLGNIKQRPAYADLKWNNTIDLRLDVPAYFTLTEIELHNIPHISPWKKALEDVGLRSMHPMVDLTNYVALTLGQPMHAFDADCLKGPLVLRMAQPGEIFTALDGQTHKLCDTILVLADDQGVQALPGVMGGLHSAVTEATKRVYLEAAWFEPDMIAATGQKLRIASEARTRFERGVDPLGVDMALQWVLDACKEWTTILGSTKQGSLPQCLDPIAWDDSLVKASLGIDVPDALTLLTKLGCTVDGSAVTPPSWRYDLRIAMDLVEEVARLYGYHMIPNVSLPFKAPRLNRQMHHNVHQALTSRGLFEVMTWSMTGEKESHMLGGGIPLLEPLTQDMAIMRASLMAGLLPAASRNQARHDEPIALYEWAHVYHPKEQAMIAGLRANTYQRSNWQKPRDKLDFYDVKADVWAVLESLHINPSLFQIEPEAPSWYHPHQSCTLKKGPKVLGYLGTIHPKITEHFSLNGSVVGFELITSVLSDFKRLPSGQLPSVYQAVSRDFCFVMPHNQAVDAIVQLISKIENVTRVDIMDVYKLNDSERSIVFQVTLQSRERTLTDADIHAVSEKLIQAIDKKWGFKLRG